MHIYPAASRVFFENGVPCAMLVAPPFSPLYAELSFLSGTYEAHHFFEAVFMLLTPGQSQWEAEGGKSSCQQNLIDGELKKGDS